MNYFAGRKEPTTDTEDTSYYSSSENPTDEQSSDDVDFEETIAKLKEKDKATLAKAKPKKAPKVDKYADKKRKPENDTRLDKVPDNYDAINMNDDRDVDGFLANILKMKEYKSLKNVSVTIKELVQYDAQDKEQNEMNKADNRANEKLDYE